jgi:hypothetical protein
MLLVLNFFLNFTDYGGSMVCMETVMDSKLGCLASRIIYHLKNILPFSNPQFHHF